MRNTTCSWSSSKRERERERETIEKMRLVSSRDSRNAKDVWLRPRNDMPCSSCSLLPTDPTCSHAPGVRHGVAMPPRAPSPLHPFAPYLPSLPADSLLLVQPERRQRAVCQSGGWGWDIAADVAITITTAAAATTATCQETAICTRQRGKV